MFISLFAVAGLLLYTLLSVAYVRLRPYPKSSLTWETVTPDAAQAIESQFISIRAEGETKAANAALTWVRGTNLFLTNAHVTKDLCKPDEICEFFPLHMEVSPYRLRQILCIPGEDICAHTLENEDLDIDKAKFATPTVGQKVFYRDIEKADNVYQGTITAVTANDIQVSGYARHGFSGSPIFNERGEILGVLKSLDEGFFWALPHAFIFGWTQTTSFRAARWSSIDWFKKSQQQVNLETWQSAVLNFKSKFELAPTCSDDYLSFKTFTLVYGFLTLTKNPIAEDHLSQLQKIIDGDQVETISQLCQESLKQLE